MSDNKRPSYPWYPRDFATDEPVQLMSLTEEGAYRRLLDHQWLHGSIPGDVAQLASICKNLPAREMKKIWPKVEACFEKLPGLPVRLRNRKLERVREEKEAFLAHAREAGKRGGEEASRRRREKMDDPSNPTTEPIPTLVAESYPAFASASASAVTGTVPTEPASREPEDTTDGQIMAAIREHLYRPDGKPPEGWAEGREFSIMRELRKIGKSGAQIRDVVEGLGCLLRDGRVDWLKGKATLRAVFNSKSGVLDMWGQAADAYYRQGATFAKAGHRKPEDIRAAIQRELAKARRA